MNEGLHDGIRLLFFECCVVEYLFDERECDFSIGLDGVVEGVEQVFAEVCGGEYPYLVLLAGSLELFQQRA